MHSTYIMTQMLRGQDDYCTSHTLNNYYMIRVAKRLTNISGR